MQQRVTLSVVCGLVVALGLGASATALAGSGNYLIVTAQDYSGSVPLNQFVNAKSAMGFNVSVYTVAPTQTNHEIRSYILDLAATPERPKYILLVGDTNGYDATTNTVPHFDGGGTKHAATDLPYACFQPWDDWIPDAHIGRFSVQSVAQLQTVVDKSLQAELGPYPDPTYVKRAAFLATSDSSAQAEQTHDWCINTCLEPAGVDCTRIYATQGGGTADVTAAVNAGSLFTVYFGHSSSSGWWDPSFNQSNVNALSNDGLYGLVFAFSCNTARYTNGECFGETWVRAPNKGAAAYLSTSTYTYYGGNAWEPNRLLEKYFYEAFFSEGFREVRPAWDRALERLMADYGAGDSITRNCFEMFVLLGDPALHLPLDTADLNCDGTVNAGDIDPFVLALTDAVGYAAAYPTCDRSFADCNADGVINAADIDVFVQMVTSSD